MNVTPKPGNNALEDFVSKTSGASLKLVKGVRYRFEKLLGIGGFASVYLVRDLALMRRVAMKVLSRKFAGELESRGNFVCEAQIAAQFHHPNIVFVYEVGEYTEQEYEKNLQFPEKVLAKYPERFIYFTMQYVEGQSLADIMQQEKSLMRNAASSYSSRFSMHSPTPIARAWFTVISNPPIS